MDLNSNQQILDDLLASSLGASPEKPTRGQVYKKLFQLQNVTSFSVQELLSQCARKFQLAKLSATLEVEEESDEDNFDFAFGTAVGAGIAHYDEHQDIRAAIWQVFLHWNADLLGRKERRPYRPEPNKSFYHAVWAIKLYATFYAEETDLSEYSVVKSEASVGVDFQDGHYYVGHIDEILQHKETGRFKVKENKTTGYSNVDPALYANSNQALSYALVVDALGASEYTVQYMVYSSPAMQWITYEFVKTPLAKAEWIQGQLFIHADIDLYTSHNFFPKNGASCLAWNRRCQFFESCNFNSKKVFGVTFAELPKVQSLDEIEEIEHLDYRFTWQELIKTQQERLEG